MAIGSSRSMRCCDTAATTWTRTAAKIGPTSISRSPALSRERWRLVFRYLYSNNAADRSEFDYDRNRMSVAFEATL